MRQREIHDARGPGRLIAGLALLLVSWAVGNAPFTSPDEAQHFIRAASLVRGQVVGDPVAGLGALPPGREGLRLRWQRRTTRSVTIPARLDPAGLGCNALRPDLPADCTPPAPGRGSIRLESSVATYDPLPSIAPGIATLIVHSSATGGLRAARLAGAALALALIALGLIAAGAGFWSRLGLCLALTPGVLFVLSGVGANSLEIAGACTLALTLFRCCVTGAASRRALVTMAAGGLAMVGSRPTSVIWLAVAVLAGALCVERPRELIATRARRSVAIVWATGILASAVWDRAVEPSPPFGLSSASARAALDFVPEMLREFVGVFGPLDTRPPGWLGLPLVIALAALLASAFARSGRRVRRGLVVLVLAAVVLPTALNATVLWFTGFALQGRHVMALAVMAPILAGVALDARGVRAAPWMRWACAAIWAFTQVAFWLFNAHRHAVGVSGSWSFLGDRPAWLPGPWVLWLAVALAGAALGGFAIAGEGVEGAAAP